MANPDSDILGHCTGRLVTGRGRPESEFDVDAVLDACLRFDKALEINCRPERLDPPKRILRQAVDLGLKISIDTDSTRPSNSNGSPSAPTARPNAAYRWRRSSTRGPSKNYWRGRRATVDGVDAASG